MKRPGDVPGLLALGVLLVVAAALAWPVLDLPFWNSDDWFHIEVAAGMLSGDGAAFLRAWHGHVPADGLRLVPYSLWALDYAAFGFSPAGYYATNLAVHLATAAAVFVLAARFGGWPAGLAAGAVFTLNPATTQPLYFLSSREDSLVVLLFVTAAAAWPTLRRTPRGRAIAAVLYGLACFCKLPAVVLPAVIGLLEWKSRRTSAEDSPTVLAVAVPFAVAAAVFGAAVLLALDLGEAAEGLGSDTALASSGLLVRRAHILLAPSGAALDGAPTMSDVATAAIVGAALVALLALRRRPTDLLVVGLGWLAVTLVVPVPWLLRDVMPGDLGGRYLLLPSVGLALAAAGLWPRPDSRPTAAVSGALAVLLLVACAAGFGGAGRTMLSANTSTAGDLIRVIAPRLDGEGPPMKLWVGIQRPDRGAMALLSSKAIQLRFPRLEEPPRVFLQGSKQVRQSILAPYDYGVFGPLDETLDPASVLEFDELMVFDRHDGVTAWDIGAPAVETVEGRQARWAFADSPLGWRAGGRSKATWRAGSGWVLPAWRPLGEDALVHVLGGPPERRPPLLLSYPLQIEPGSLCSLVFELEYDAAGEEADAAGLAGGPFALLTWSSSEDLRDAYDRMTLLPLPRGRGSVGVVLQNLPAWSGTIRRVALSGPSDGGELVLRALDAVPCPEAL